MNIRRPWLALALLFSVVAVIGFAIPSSLAYIVAQSNTIVNSFTATYIAPEDTAVEIRVHKTVVNVGAESIGPEDFRFMLTCQDNGEAHEMTTGKDGFASLTLHFDAADLNKTYTYRLSEVNDGRDNVVYSDQVYEIRIFISENTHHQLVADLSVNGQPVTEILADFENIYSSTIDLPNTGDSSHPLLYLLLMAASLIGLAVLGRKQNRQVMR